MRRAVLAAAPLAAGALEEAETEEGEEIGEEIENLGMPEDGAETPKPEAKARPGKKALKKKKKKRRGNRG